MLKQTLILLISLSILMSITINNYSQNEIEKEKNETEKIEKETVIIDVNEEKVEIPYFDWSKIIGKPLNFDFSLNLEGSFELLFDTVKDSSSEFQLGMQSQTDWNAEWKITYINEKVNVGFSGNDVGDQEVTAPLAHPTEAWWIAVNKENYSLKVSWAESGFNWGGAFSVAKGNAIKSEFIFPKTKTTFTLGFGLAMDLGEDWASIDSGITDVVEGGLIISWVWPSSAYFKLGFTSTTQFQSEYYNSSTQSTDTGLYIDSALHWSFKAVWEKFETEFITDHLFSSIPESFIYAGIFLWNNNFTPVEEKLTFNLNCMFSVMLGDVVEENGEIKIEGDADRGYTEEDIFKYYYSDSEFENYYQYYTTLAGFGIEALYLLIDFNSTIDFFENITLKPYIRVAINFWAPYSMGLEDSTSASLRYIWFSPFNLEFTVPNTDTITIFADAMFTLALNEDSYFLTSGAYVDQADAQGSQTDSNDLTNFDVLYKIGIKASY